MSVYTSIQNVKTLNLQTALLNFELLRVNQARDQRRRYLLNIAMLLLRIHDGSELIFDGKTILLSMGRPLADTNN